MFDTFLWLFTFLWPLAYAIAALPGSIAPNFFLGSPTATHNDNGHQSDPDPGSQVPDTSENDLVAHLLQRISQLEAHASTPPTTLNIKEPRISSPKPFSGSRADARAFIEKCDNVFRVQPHTYGTEESKIAFVINLLDGDAYHWFQPYLELGFDARPTWAMSWSEFKIQFLKQFGDNNIIETSRSKLRTLRQTSSASHYATEFRRHSAYLGWNDNTLRQTFFDGLKEEVKYRILTPQSFNSFEDLVDAAIKWDDLLFQFCRTAPAKNTTLVSTPRNPLSTPTGRTPAPRPFQRPTPAPVQDNRGTPMDIDSVRHRPLTPEERQTRMANNLCLYCGKPGHMARDCLSRPKNPNYKARANAATSKNMDLNSTPQA